ncbi:sulfotransferase family 2 domain-containing protein [Cobetia amphilecti]|uniref:sulfotransferase family 2 domain-containing protein n=1 Tax=Cobetia amphilecti TaxID=1055104 RepID=UPI0029423F50|nr:sulfotransferase family 2 domain-containing protein [Cobetia amphilecti]WOI25150.1 sulfotransferase family 2 domain-containing protein [Cobetia amphilecti]
MRDKVGGEFRRCFNKNKCIFVGVPRVGSESIFLALGDEYIKKRKYHDYRFYQKIDPSRFDQYFKFAFVRHPLDRLFSAYQYLRHTGDHSQSHKVLSEGLRQYPTFDAFVLNGLTEEKFKSHSLFTPQSYFIVDDNDRVIMDYVGRFENFEENLSHVLSHLGIKQGRVHNKRWLTSRSVKCDESTVNVIRKHYSRDFDNFNYE